MIETFHAFLLPLLYSSTPDHGNLEMNYDATLSSSRRPLARSVQACRQAMLTIRDDLVRWGNRVGSTGSNASQGGAGSAGREGLASEMRRVVDMVALTPTKQEMQSSVGREVSTTSKNVLYLRELSLLTTDPGRSSCGSARYMRYTIFRCCGRSRFMSS